MPPVFIFTGLAVAVAFQCGLFNIGGEGQALIGGLGLALVCLHLDFLPAPLLIPLAIAGAALFGAAWAFVPAYLLVRRGSHIVITTIMFNFIAASVIVYLLVNVMSPAGSMQPETRGFAEHARLPYLYELAGAWGIELPSSPLNVSFLLALLCCVGVWLYIWHTRAGYRVRVVGASPAAAGYGGITPATQVLIAMMLSGGLAGCMSLNELLGVQHRLVLEFTGGFGFVGIAVALMGRGHPAGIVPAALLFGALYQGGAELAFAIPAITRDLVVMIQGLVILFRRRTRIHVCPRPPALARAPFGRLTWSFFTRWSWSLTSALRLSVPLLLAALAGLFAERSGIIDIGLEGKMLGAAFAAGSAAAVTGSAWGRVGGRRHCLYSARNAGTDTPALRIAETRWCPAWPSTFWFPALRHSSRLRGSSRGVGRRSFPMLRVSCPRNGRGRPCWTRCPFWGPCTESC